MISKAFSRAFGAIKQSVPDTLKYLGVEACILLAAFTPMLFLWSGVKFLTLLTVPALILLVFPARMNAARARKDKLQGGRLCSYRLIDPEHYGSDVVYGLRRLFFILLWALPLIVFVLILWNMFSGDMDAFTMLNQIKTFGGGGKEGVPNGVLYLMLILLGTLMLLACGFAFHSGARHALAQGDPGSIRGHHGKYFLCQLCSVVTLLPLIAAVLIALSRYLPLLADLNKTVNGFLKGTVNLPNTKTTLIIVGIGAVLTLPFLPLKEMIGAAFVDGLKKE